MAKLKYRRYISSNIHNTTRKRNITIPTILIAKRSLLPEIRHYRPLSRRSLLSEISDFRTFHPRPNYRPFKDNYARVVRPYVDLSDRHIFNNRPRLRLPKQALICVRRKRRAEVLHALGKTGKGSKFNRRPRRNSNSYIWC